MKMSNPNQLEVLKLVGSKLETRRDELMDIINVSLSSALPSRVSLVYDTQLELATIEKALEINRFFQIQLQENILSDIIEKNKGEDIDNHPETDYPEDAEDLKK